MKKLLMAAIVSLVPLTGMAQDQHAVNSTGESTSLTRAMFADNQQPMPYSWSGQARVKRRDNGREETVNGSGTVYAKNTQEARDEARQEMTHQAEAVGEVIVVVITRP